MPPQVSKISVTPTALWDACALLTLFKAVNTVGRVDGNLKVQKVTFLAELEGRREHLKVAHFRFFRFTFGPWSDSLERFVTALTDGQFLTKSGTLTSRADYVLEVAQDSIQAKANATEATHILMDVGRKYGKLSGTQLKEKIYEMRVRLVGASADDPQVKIKQLSKGVEIIDPINEHDLAEVAPFDDETLAELVAEFNMPAEVLDRNSAGYRQTISDALKRAESALS